MEVLLEHFGHLINLLMQMPTPSDTKHIPDPFCCSNTVLFSFFNLQTSSHISWSIDSSLTMSIYDTINNAFTFHTNRAEDCHSDRIVLFNERQSESHFTSVYGSL